MCISNVGVRINDKHFTAISRLVHVEMVNLGSWLAGLMNLHVNK